MSRFNISNFPFLITAGGAASLFISNFFAQALLDKSTFGLYSLSLFIFSIIIIAGALGVEQAIIRLVKVDDTKIIIDNNLLMIIAVVLVTVPPVFAKVLSSIYSIEAGWALYVSILFATASIVFSAFYKVSGSMLAWSIVLNGWKFVVIAYVWLLYTQGDFSNFTDFIWIFLFGFIVISFFFIRGVSVTFESTQSIASVFWVFLFGFFSIVGFTLYDFFDRIVISKLFSEIEFGRLYFQYSVIVSFSLMFLSFKAAKNTNVYKKKYQHGCFE